MSDTTVTSKGQVTIPKHIRERRGIAAGTRLEVSEEGDDIVLRKTAGARRRKSRDAEFEAYLEKVRGSMKLGMTTDEYMELLRGE
jgi:AbrB family looped-hinge helix DNA binding protein